MDKNPQASTLLTLSATIIILWWFWHLKCHVTRTLSWTLNIMLPLFVLAFHKDSSTGNTWRIFFYWILLKAKIHWVATALSWNLMRGDSKPAGVSFDNSSRPITRTAFFSLKQEDDTVSTNSHTSSWKYSVCQTPIRYHLLQNHLIPGTDQSITWLA